MKRNLKSALVILSVLLLGGGSVHSQIVTAVKWSYAAKRTSDSEALVYLKAVIQEGWHVFSVNQKPGGPLKTTFSFSKSSDYGLVGKVTEPRPMVKFDQTFGLEVMYFEKEVVFQQKLKLKAGVLDGVLKGKVEFMACNESMCLPPSELEFSIPLK